MPGRGRRVPGTRTTRSRTPRRKHAVARRVDLGQPCAYGGDISMPLSLRRDNQKRQIRHSNSAQKPTISWRFRQTRPDRPGNGAEGRCGRHTLRLRRGERVGARGRRKHDVFVGAGAPRESLDGATARRHGTLAAARTRRHTADIPGTAARQPDTRNSTFEFRAKHDRFMAISTKSPGSLWKRPGTAAQMVCTTGVSWRARRRSGATAARRFRRGLTRGRSRYDTRWGTGTAASHRRAHDLATRFPGTHGRTRSGHG